MLEATREGFWGTRYSIGVDGHTVAEWRVPGWRTSGGIVVAGQFFPVETRLWSNRFTMFDRVGTTIAVAENVARRTWTGYADGRYHEFRRASFLSTTVLHVVGDREVGWLRRRSAWTGGIEAELPALSLLAQVFVVGAVITTWDQQAAAAG
ncbi:hypothetical protein [Virgisporangium aurantiacum]|nr:hypothetical protein [Virgisporangium aurantiacum]